MAKPVLKFGKLSIEARVSRTLEIAVATAKPEGVAIYVTPIPTLASITASANLLRSNQFDFKAGVLGAKTVRDRQNRSNTLLMNQFVTYVEVASGGDQAKIELTTLEVKALPGASVEMGKVTGVKGKVGRFAGESILSWQKMPKAGFYQIQKSADGATGWLNQGDPVTKTKAIIDGLVPETGSYYRISAGNTLGPGSWSDPLKVMSM